LLRWLEAVGVDLEGLRMILLSERESGKLSEIPPDLFEQAFVYLDDLYAQARTLDDPLGEEAGPLIEEITNVREAVREIFHERSGKILSLSMLAVVSHGGDRDEGKRMLPPEKDMFGKVSQAILDCQTTLLARDPGRTVPLPAAPPVEHAAVIQAPAAQAIQVYTLVRLLTNVDPFMGVDGRIYHLGKEDVATLPARNAEVLCERNIALNIMLGT
jgi:DNA replication factor GINS